jgi:hypothetical protein
LSREKSKDQDMALHPLAEHATELEIPDPPRKHLVAVREATEQSPREEGFSLTTPSGLGKRARDGTAGGHHE